jgi:putative solute:sodium symporter small subunit
MFKEELDQFSLGGAPLGFWMAQQGSIICFVVLLIIYSFLMNKLDQKHGYTEEGE